MGVVGSGAFARGLEECADDPDYRDHDDYACADWSGYEPCMEYGGYTAEQMLELRTNCPVTCGQCPEDTTTTAAPSTTSGPTTTTIEASTTEVPTTTTAVLTTSEASTTEAGTQGCEDDADYVDKESYSCRDWEGYACYTYSGYTAAEMLELRTNCPAACGLCEESTTVAPTTTSEALTTTTAVMTTIVEPMTTTTVVMTTTEPATVSEAPTTTELPTTTTMAAMTTTGAPATSTEAPTTAAMATTEAPATTTEAPTTGVMTTEVPEAPTTGVKTSIAPITAVPDTTTMLVSTTRLNTSDSGVTYYVTQTGQEVVYKCKSADDSCAVWLDTAGLSSLIPSMTTFKPTAIHLDQEADGTSRGLLVGTSTGALIYCDMTPSVCRLVTSNLGSVGAVASAWDSEHTLTKFFFTTKTGAGVVNADGSGSVTYPGAWSLSTGAFFLVTPDSDTSDIIGCSTRNRVERCPYVLNGKVSDCTTLLSGKCSSVAPEYAADGSLSGFVAVTGNQVKSCELWGTNCELNPAIDPVEITNVTAELEVVIDESANSEDVLNPASDIWFGVEDVFNELTGTEGWTLDSVTRVNSTSSTLRRLADVANYALSFKLRYAGGSQIIPSVDTMFENVQHNFMETINEKVTGGNWTITSEKYIAIEDEGTAVVVATSEDAPEWATIILGKTTTTTAEKFDYDFSPRCAASPFFWTALFVLASFFFETL